MTLQAAWMSQTRQRFALSQVGVVEVILCLVFIVGAWRNKWLADDGYIYLTYVQNLTENGLGPVFNSGETVEGFTSPAWYLILSLLNLVTPGALLDLRQAVLLLSIFLSIAAVVAWIPVETRAVSLDGNSPSQARADDRTRFAFNNNRLNLPLAFVAAWYPLHSFATSGLETPLILIALMTVIYYVWSGADSSWAVGAIAAGLILVRPELGLLSLLLLGRHWIGNRTARSFTISLSVFVAPLIALMIVRVLVYGQFLPNTYYAKTGTRFGVRSGLNYLRDTMLAYGLHWVVAAAVLVVVIPFIRQPKVIQQSSHARRVWFLGAASLMTAYVIVLGGDFMHARFLLPSAMLTLAVFAGLGTKTLSMVKDPPRQRVLTAAAVTLAIVLSLMYTTSVQRLLAKGFLTITDEAYAYSRTNPDLNSWNSTAAHPWAEKGNALRKLAEMLGTEIGIATGGIGQISYFGQSGHGNVYVYDMLALTRPDVARLDMGDEGRGRVGHAKRAPDALIASNPRVDFHIGKPASSFVESPYFEGWKGVATVKVDDLEFVLMNPDLIDPLVQHGAMTEEQARKLRAWILEKIAGPRIDRNFVTFLTMRYHRQDEVLTRLQQLAELDRSSAWRKWLDSTEEERRLLDANGCSGLGGAECFGRAVDRQKASPIPALENVPDWNSK